MAPLRADHGRPIPILIGALQETFRGDGIGIEAVDHGEEVNGAEGPVNGRRGADLGTNAEIGTQKLRWRWAVNHRFHILQAEGWKGIRDKLRHGNVSFPAKSLIDGLAMGRIL